MQKTSIIMISGKDNLEYMKDSIESIRRYTVQGSYELIVVEDGRSPEARLWLSDQIHIRSLFFENELTIGQAWNRAIDFANGDMILLMHPDTLATEGWLDILISHMITGTDVAVIAPSTVKSENSTSGTSFVSMEDMLKYASHLKNTAHIKEKLFLSSECILFKKSIMDQLGNFNESLTEDACLVDYQMNIHRFGLRSLLCEKAFVYHYQNNESTYNILDDEIFKKNWGFGLNELRIETNKLNMIKRFPEEMFRVLFIDINDPDLIISFKSRYPKAFLESCNSREIEKYEFSYLFDYIIIGPNGFSKSNLEFVNQNLSNTGQFFGEFKNSNSYEIVKRILLNQNDLSKQTYWRINDIIEIFDKAEFKEIDLDYSFSQVQEIDESLINQLRDSVEQLPNEFEVQSFLVSARKYSKREIIFDRLNLLLTSPNEDTMKTILQYSVETVIQVVEEMEDKAIQLLNHIGLFNFEQKRLNEVLPYLTKAYDLNPEEDITLFNLATFMYAIEEDEAALKWLLLIQNKSKQILEWIDNLQKSIYESQVRKVKVKFLLRRIENDVDREESCQELCKLIQDQSIVLEEIFQSVEVDLIDKTATLNRVAVSSFNYSMYEAVLPLLRYSYELNNSNVDTLFNLGSVLFTFGAYQEGLNFLKQVKFPEQEIIELIKEIEEKIAYE